MHILSLLKINIYGIIKNKDLDKIDEYIEKHRVAPAKEWSKLINDNEEIRRYLK